ncbi:hypothetical protein FACS1894202_09100 [Clostridia bacterium]|nr:hypothetical protein FACS1894202_09100 [Clostridia bacterium]
MFDLKYFEGHRKMAFDALAYGADDNAACAINAMVTACNVDMDSHLPVGAVLHLLCERAVCGEYLNTLVRDWLEKLDLNEYADYYKE